MGRTSPCGRQKFHVVIWSTSERNVIKPQLVNSVGDSHFSSKFLAINEKLAVKIVMRAHLVVVY